MKLSNDKEVRKILDVARKNGWKVEKAGSNHIILYPPDKKHNAINLPSTPSSTRGMKNSIARLRRAGLPL